jgi:hypothetical protein
LANERFSFSASAAGLAAHLTNPIVKTDVKGESVLQTCGGYSSQSVGRYKIEEIVSIESASVQVSGINSNGAFETLSVSTIEGLDILGIVQADRIICRISSKYPVGSSEAIVSLVGSSFEGLRIGGKSLNVTFNDALVKEHKFKDVFEARRASQGAFQRALEAAGKPDDDIVKKIRSFSPYGQNGKAEENPATAVTVGATLVQSHDFEGQGCRKCEHVIFIPQFGTIILGEVIVTREATSLTMLQADLGSPVQGMCCVSSGRSGGTPLPPPPPTL